MENSMVESIPSRLRRQSVAALRLSGTANAFTPLLPAKTDSSYAIADIGFDNMLEQAFHSWYRLYFLSKEVFDLTAQYSLEETARCVNCNFNACNGFLWYFRPISAHSAH